MYNTPCSKYTFPLSNTQCTLEYGDTSNISFILIKSNDILNVMAGNVFPLPTSQSVVMQTAKVIFSIEFTSQLQFYKK